MKFKCNGIPRECQRMCVVNDCGWANDYEHYFIKCDKLEVIL